MNDKDAYEKKLEAQLDEAKAEIAKLTAKAREVGADAQMEYNKQIEELEAASTEAQSKLKAIRESGGEAWEDIKQGASDAWERLNGALKSAASRFK